MTMVEDPPVAGDAPDPEPGRRRWPVVAGAAALVAVAAVAAVVLVGGDDGGEEPVPTTSDLPAALESVPPDPDARELLDLLAAGRSGTWHAVYSAGDDVTLEVWRAGDRLRQDSITVSGDDRVATASFATADGAALCTRSGDDDWVCTEVEPSDAGGDGFVGSVAAQLAAADVAPGDGEVAGHEARCFAVSSPDGEGEVCVTTDGVPARVAMGEVAFELTSLDDDVPADVFDLPADPVQAG